MDISSSPFVREIRNRISVVGKEQERESSVLQDKV